MSAQFRSASPSPSEMIADALSPLLDFTLGCYELRAWQSAGGVVRGFYDNLRDLARDAVALDDAGSVEGIYVTLNPVSPALLLQSRNKLSVAKSGGSADDDSVVRRRLLLFDFDPVRPSGTNSTEAQLALALERAEQAKWHLLEAGFSDLMVCTSGNGAHLLGAIDLPNDEGARELVRRVLNRAHDLFSDEYKREKDKKIPPDLEVIEVDCKVFNASRVCKVYGSVARKGEADPLRPHRRAEVLYTPASFEVTPCDVLEAFAPAPVAQKPESVKQFSGEFEDLKRELGSRIMSHSSARRNVKGNWDCRALCHDGHGDTGLFHNPQTNVTWCNAVPSCSLSTILVSFGLPAFPVKTASAFRIGNSVGASDEQGVNEGDEPPVPDEELPLSDLGNGLRFARAHGDDLRYSYTAAKWVVWDSRRWIMDDTGKAMLRAKQTVMNLLAVASKIVDDDKRKAFLDHHRKSQAHDRMTKMLLQAQSELPVSLDDFDLDPYLFNVRNGTIDLRTGELRAHARQDMLTKIAPVEYDPHAECPRWLAFLDRIFESDEALIYHLQKAVGYSLTGSIDEQCLMILYGVGANGKSVFLSVLGALLGDYGQSLNVSTLTYRRQGGASNDVACLRGARFLAAIETESDQKLAEAHVKNMTGGDKLRARFLFKEEFEFVPQFKIWLAANHKPQVSNDHAIWRRIRLIPFNITIPKEEQNPQLAQELKDELPGILAWAVRGCLLWQHEGLGMPDAVKEATDAYREEMDTLADFLADACVVGAAHQATVTEIYNRYETWCMANGEQKQPAKWLRTQLLERGFKPGRDSSRRFWKGIGLIRDSENDKTEYL